MIPESFILRRHESVFKYREGAAPAAVRQAMTRAENPVTYDPEEGFLMHFNGLKYPRPSFLDMFELRAVDTVKKYLKGWMKMLSSPPLVFAFPLILFSPKRFLARWMDLFGEFAFNELSEFITLPQHLPRACKELYRVGSEMGLDDRFLEPVCAILDQDLNYRWPLQDILSSLDKGEMERNPAREVKRLFNLLDARWDHHGRGKWKTIGLLCWIFLLVSPSARKWAREFGYLLNPDRMKLGTYDLYNCLLQEGYDYLGKDQEERAKLHATL